MHDWKRVRLSLTTENWHTDIDQAYLKLGVMCSEKLICAWSGLYGMIGGFYGMNAGISNPG
jgi:hypothetical protein